MRNCISLFRLRYKFREFFYRKMSGIDLEILVYVKQMGFLENFLAVCSNLTGIEKVKQIVKWLHRGES